MVSVQRSELRPHPQHEDMIQIIEATMSSLDAYSLVERALDIDEDGLSIRGTAYPLKGRRVWVCAIGKAAVSMAMAAESKLDRWLEGGVAVTPWGHDCSTTRIHVIEAGHPLPTTAAGAEALLSLCGRVAAGDLVLCLISGGGSALIAAPPPPISVEELAHTTAQLLASGATINDVNTVRRHLSLVQGGGLMRHLQSTTVISLILSDVIGDQLEAIASGPTVSDPTTFAEARDVLTRHELWEQLPRSIRSHLQDGIEGTISETLKPGDTALQNSQTVVIGNNETAVHAAVDEARACGYNTVKRESLLVGEAAVVGHDLATQAIEMARRAQGKWALIAGGETTVTVRGSGTGGRNQELALAASIALQGTRGLSLAAFGTDGIDGVTQAAGGWVDGETVARAAAAGRRAGDALLDNDSHGLLAASGDLLFTGATQTNVADVCVILGDPRA